MARAISAVEDGTPEGHQLVKELFPHSGKASVIGVTGSPGVGKSTLVEKLAADFRLNGERVGIVAVDPTSPFSGGAILGDRIRMQSLFADDGVYIRSMATRGHLGGLAVSAQDVVTVLDAAGCGVVLIETVGVGQDEVEIARHADVTVLVLIPGMGDDVQTFKAGVMEIADIYVINKADRPGVERVEQELRAMLAISPRRSDWSPPLIRTVATQGEGIQELRAALSQFRAFAEKNALRLRRREQSRARLLETVRQRLLEKVLGQLPAEALDAYADDLASHRRDPHSVAEELLKKVDLRKTIS
ncbi:MAG: methylmalonyl Co-A mutase-associated GTPase MeaB [Acidobacteria bacterium]|nr:methylmalonyl Co-A mutase-associated GTPase MeaB [Acidobacteriota bacterium]